MPLSLDENQAQYQIKSYQPGLVRINDQIYTKNLIITPNQLIENWELADIDAMTSASFFPIIELKPTILLIGTGSQPVLVPLARYGELINLGIGVEVMDTASACRTYNALSAENRNVAAALILK